MADNFTVVSQQPGFDSINGAPPQDVVFVGIVTIPNGTYLEFPIADAAYKAGLVGAAAIGWATIVETVWTEDWVVGVQWTQVVNPSNQLVSSLIITVASESGNSTATLTVPITQLGPKLHQPQITALHDQLDDAEKL